ncbi:YwqI/YxiC family protein [Alkalihalobacillus hwajinpoensis]|uniref:YwqI/YxiC family protein n=1 Tax=Guptibacillus hwajinpoensis TaxID=208199 RepID=UPI001883D029|nr:YwqI/YxiC family protein [Pseudalkalibacillus hwajinpoensis]MBF0705397.1 YwqI/YxiC family protein [Pseudalkalibacillus hwajinpoensis]
MYIAVSGGGSSTEIKLNYSEVMTKLEEAMNAVQHLTLPEPSAGQLGRNKINYTDAWINREQNLQRLLQDYMTVVQKNLEDTKANVDSLKEQDEAITRS